MLVLTRRLGQALVIDGGIRITVLEVKGTSVRLGIAAPPSVTVDRQEIHARLAQWASPPAPEEAKEPPPVLVPMGAEGPSVAVRRE